ncbi:succinylglutamate desuccinylase/aspartoacylase family protein [Aquimarina agarilytica]|uniref:succinylglutamate desuccinylase/aspartoacylase family protein n=1 Tax=Aquimarina agarilytica TaxID=1087449 RepID=UPI00028951F6|nr:succinylglutamate desuccinylase/aspartoacylase family protein [Aquimarina agarilytica]
MNTDILQILGQEIKLGQRKTINLNIAKLYTSTKVEIPIVVERSKIPGPVVLITAGIHGDEINGVEIVRQLIQKKINRPAKGTIICIPVLNVFGFLSMSRNFPDGRDLNRVFPGSKNGSLASQFAYQFSTEILPHADICIDFHTGGASRYNAPQIRISKNNEISLELAHVFNAPFLLYSKNIDKSYRATCSKKGKTILLFEGGKSLSNDKAIAKEGIEGTMRVLKHLGMLQSTFEIETPKTGSVIIENSHWIRAKYSGLIHLKVACGTFVKKGDELAVITDPYGTKRHVVKATNKGYIINTNEAPIVYQGDAIFHISSDKKISND